jgi:hypothetical protein
VGFSGQDNPAVWSSAKLQAMADATIQTALAVGAPTLAVLTGILINNSRLSDLRAHMDARFDDICESWRSELRRLAMVLDKA